MNEKVSPLLHWLPAFPFTVWLSHPPSFQKLLHHPRKMAVVSTAGWQAPPELVLL